MINISDLPGDIIFVAKLSIVRNNSRASVFAFTYAVKRERIVSIVSLHLYKEYLTVVKFRTSVLLLMKSMCGSLLRALMMSGRLKSG